jgi:hypothetical protein
MPACPHEAAGSREDGVVVANNNPANGITRVNEILDTQDSYACLRSDSRQSMFLQSAIRRPHDPAEYSIRIRNLSAGGLMADCAFAFEEGEAVWVSIRAVGTAVGTVAWYRAGRLGVQFDVAIDPALARQPVGGRTEALILPPVTDGWRPGFRIR